MMHFKTGFFALIGALALCAPANAGTKDDIRDLQVRLEQAEQAMAGQRQATLRIAALERQIQEMTGTIEELTYRLDQSNQRLDAVTAALSGGMTMADGSDAMGTSPTGGPVDLMNGGAPANPALGDPTMGDPIGAQIAQETGDATGVVGGGDIALPLDPNAAFDYASGFLMSGDYPRAKAAFALYVEAFPNHPRTPDAQFRLGEIHLALGEKAAAADVFIAHIRNFPNNPRTAEAYLKLGTAFARLEKKTEACTVFKTMKSKFPNAAGAVLQRADLEMARIDCK